MKLHDQLTPKQRRSIKRDLGLIFSLRGVVFPKSIEDLRQLGFLSPYKIKIKDKQVYFSKKSKQAFERICGFIEDTDKFKNNLNYDNIFYEVLKEIERWFNQYLIPDDFEFIEPLDKKLESQISIFKFFCRVEGVLLKGINKLVIGNKEIVIYDPQLISGLEFSIERLPDIINEEYRNSLVISGKEIGSHSVALEKFYFNSELCISIIRLYSCILYRRAIHGMQVRLVNTCFGAYAPASSFGWDDAIKSPVFSRYFKDDYNIEIGEEQLSYLRETCFFDQLAILIEKDKKSEVEEAVVKSVFWFGEAQKDRIEVFKWIKLWSCMECFFSVNENDITESNARGISALLVYGGFKLEGLNDFRYIKGKIKEYYRMRSKAIHQAEFNHIERKILEEFSYIVAWVIIVMVSLSIRGYVNLSQIREQAIRLDNVKQS
jgi:hypothetical protein